MSGLVGADVAALRDLAERFATAAQTLTGAQGILEGAVSQSTVTWGGLDAEEFRHDWGSRHSPSLLAASDLLGGAATLLRRNADQQESASNDLGGSGGASPGGYGPISSPGGPLGGDSSGPGLGTAAGGVYSAVMLGLKANTLRGLVPLASSFVQAARLAAVSPAAASATTFLREMSTAKAAGLLGKLGMAGKVLGGAGGAFAIVGGINDIINPQHDGWRGGGDRAAGVFSVIGGAGTMAMAAGLLTNPVGITIVVGAGVVAGAWALGNLVYDNWDSITGFFDDPGDYLADGWSDLKDAGSSAVEAIGDIGSTAVNKVSEGLSAVGNFVGGLFS